MAEKTPMDVIYGLLADATEEFSKLSLHTGKTTGQRMQELEREIADLKQQRDYWHDDAEGLRADNVAAYEAIPPVDRKAHIGKSVAELISTVAAERNAAQEELDAIRVALQMTPTQMWLTDDGRIDPIPTIEHMVRVLTGRDERVNAELIELRTRNQRQFADLTAARQELTNLRNTHHEWVNGQRQKPPSLNDLLTKMNDVITMQIAALSPTRATGRVVDLRRLRLAGHTVQDDVELVADKDQLRRAANAILDSEPGNWPWAEDEYWDIVNSGEALLHACVLFIAHHDATRKANH